MINLEKKLNEFGITVVWRWSAGKDWRRDLDKIPDHIKIDALLVNGEGSIHHSYQRDRSNYLSLLGKFARQKLNVPAFLINTTVFKNEKDVYDNLRAFDGIFVRESFSQKILDSHGICAHVVPDLTFARPLVVKMSKKRKGICGVDSVLPESSDAIQQFCSEHKWEYKSIKYPEPGFHLPALFAKTEFLKKITKELVRSIAEYRRINSFNAFIGAHKLVLSGRFHGVTLCLLTNTPFLALESNTPKITWLLQDIFGHANRVLAPDALLYTDVSKYCCWTETEEQQIKKYCFSAPQKIDGMLQDIKAKM